jgi:trigger factor
VQGGQVPMLVGEVVRGKALALVLEKAKVLDESGRPVDLEALREDAAEETIGELLDPDEQVYDEIEPEQAN